MTYTKSFLFKNARVTALNSVHRRVAVDITSMIPDIGSFRGCNPSSLSLGLRQHEQRQITFASSAFDFPG